MLKKQNLLVAALVGISLVFTGWQSQAVAGFYDGKTVTVITPSPAGGGVSRTAEVFIKFMAKNLEGNPNIILKNMPGGGGLKALNYLSDKGKPDGITLYWGPMRPFAKILGFPGVRFDYEKLDYIGAGAITFASLIRKDTPPGLESAADLAKTNGFKVGGQGKSSALDVFSKISLDLLGIKYRYIPGYKGQPQLNSAIRSKEINFLTTGDIGYHVFYANTIVADGTAIPLFYHSPLNAEGDPMKSENYPESVENFVEFSKTTLNKELSGGQYDAYRWLCNYQTFSLTMVLPKGAPQEALDLLRNAHAATVKDAEFKAAYTKQIGTWPIWIDGQAKEKLMKAYADISPDGLAALKDMTSTKKK